MQETLSVLFWLFCGHAVADYHLNSAAMSSDKNRHLRGIGIWPYAMTAHCLTNAGAVALATGSVGLGVAEFIAHFVIDMAKCEGWTSRASDQALHVACKVAWVAWLWRFSST